MTGVVQVAYNRATAPGILYSICTVADFENPKMRKPSCLSGAQKRNQTSDLRFTKAREVCFVVTKKGFEIFTLSPRNKNIPPLFRETKEHE